MSNAGRLIVKLENGVKHIIFNAPERRNAVDVEMIERLREIVEETKADASRVVVLTGAGDAFCAGADVKGMLGRDAVSLDVTEHLRRLTNPTILGLREMPKPVIARVHGPAVGRGATTRWPATYASPRRRPHLVRSSQRSASFRTVAAPTCCRAWWVTHAPSR